MDNTFGIRLTDSFGPGGHGKKEKAFREIYLEECEKEAEEKAQKSWCQLVCEKFGCGNYIVVELLKGSIEQDVLWKRLEPLADVRGKVFWKLLKYDGVIKRFKPQSNKDYVIVLE